MDQRGIAALIQHENRVSNEIRDLQQSGLFNAGKVWDVAQIPEDSPTSTELPEFSNPNLCPLVESAFSENNQSALWVPQIIALGQELIKPR